MHVAPSFQPVTAGLKKSPAISGLCSVVQCIWHIAMAVPTSNAPKKNS
jgi:hypothetical protein